MNSTRPALARFLAQALSGLLAAALLASLSGCGDVSEPKSPEYKTGLSADEIKSKAFSEQFPLQYQSYLSNKEDTFMSDYAGSVPWDKATGAPTRETYERLGLTAVAKKLGESGLLPESGEGQG